MDDYEQPDEYKFNDPNFEVALGESDLDSDGNPPVIAKVKIPKPTEVKEGTDSEQEGFDDAGYEIYQSEQDGEEM